MNTDIEFAGHDGLIFILRYRAKNGTFGSVNLSKVKNVEVKPVSNTHEVRLFLGDTLNVMIPLTEREDVDLVIAAWEDSQ